MHSVYEEIANLLESGLEKNMILEKIIKDLETRSNRIKPGQTGFSKEFL